MTPFPVGELHQKASVSGGRLESQTADGARLLLGRFSSESCPHSFPFSFSKPQSRTHVPIELVADQAAVRSVK